MSEIGELSEDVKTLLVKNLRELSTIEGNVLSIAENREIKTVLITSCGASEGKTISAISMAYALSTEANAKVLLIDGNLHSPKIYKLFNVEASPGLSDFFSFNVEIEYDKMLRKTEYENLMIMPHGAKVSNTLDVFKSKSIKDKLDVLRHEFDYIIFDGHSVLGSSDVSVIARYFDGIILVLECERTKWEVVQPAIEKMNKAGGNILGVVLNKRKYYIPRVLYGKI